MAGDYIIGSTGSETRLLRMLDEIRVGLNHRLEQIKQQLELQTAILIELKKDKVVSPTVSAAVSKEGVKPAESARQDNKLPFPLQTGKKK